MNAKNARSRDAAPMAPLAFSTGKMIKRWSSTSPLSQAIHARAAEDNRSDAAKAQGHLLLTKHHGSIPFFTYPRVGYVMPDPKPRAGPLGRGSISY